MNNLNESVTAFLDQLTHPLRTEIELLRKIISENDIELAENIKWNGPNYCYNNEDRITMSIQPPKQIRIVFHCGAKVKHEPSEKLIKEDFGILEWKTNDRAIATFKSLKDIEKNKEFLNKIVVSWLKTSI